jgi:N-acyl homoserine lactone hydrolase
MSDVTVEVLQTGSVGVDKAVPDRSVSSNSLAFTGLFRSRKNRILLPVKCFLITLPNGQKILVDTGWDSKVRDHPIRTITYPMWFASKPILPPCQAIDELLYQRSLQPEDLAMVIMTHLDIDHDSGLRLVKKAPAIYATKEEQLALHSLDLRYVRKPCRGISFKTIVWNGTEGPFGKSWDVFNDNSVVVLFTPGHSRGSLSIKVQAKDDFVLIVGDSGYNAHSWDSLAMPGPVASKEDLKTTLSWIAAQRKDPHCRKVLCAHDTDPTTGPQILTLE